jgi:hypothetical protein
MLINNDGGTFKEEGTGCVRAKVGNDIKIMQKYTKNRK